MQQASFIQGLTTAMERFVHPDVRRDRRAAPAHLRFVAVRLALAAAAVSLLPAYLLFGEPLTAFGLTALIAAAFLLAPVALIGVTGDLERASALSSILLSASVVALSLQAGALQSPMLALFAVIALDAAVAGSRRAVLTAALACAAGFGAVALVAGADAGQDGLFASAVAVALLINACSVAWVFVSRGERQQTTQLRSSARATAALDAVGDIVFWREASGDISFANAAARVQLGIDRREFQEGLLFERVNVGDRPGYLKALSDARSAAGLGRAIVRIAADAPTGREVRVFEMCARRVEGASNEDAVVVALHDVTERHAADELRENARRDAERIAVSKSNFLATMSHELRTPLNAIIGFSELLVQPGLLPQADPRRDEYARIINGSGQHLLEVVNAILDMSKIESGMMVVEQERVELDGVIRSSRELLAVRAAEKAVALVEYVPADLPDIVADRRALKQVLLNLMSNAVKFTPAGGEVAVSAVRDRDHVEITVSDTGCGIAESDLGKLGSPFFQAGQSYDRHHEGTGLGLSVVRGLIGLMGGSMLIESAPGFGTRVAVRLAIQGIAAGASTDPVSIATRIRARRPALETFSLERSEPAEGEGGARSVRYRSAAR